MQTSKQFIRLIQIAMLVSIALLAGVGELVARPVAPNNVLFYVLSFAAVMTLGTTAVLRRTLVLPCEASLREKPDDMALSARLKSVYILLYALCEPAALFGLVLRMNGFGLGQVWCFYAAGFLAIAFFSPQAPSLVPGSGQLPGNEKQVV
jgi:hypothetical protein